MNVYTGTTHSPTHLQPYSRHSICCLHLSGGPPESSDFSRGSQPTHLQLWIPFLFQLLLDSLSPLNFTSRHVTSIGFLWLHAHPSTYTQYSTILYLYMYCLACSRDHTQYLGGPAGAKEVNLLFTCDQNECLYLSMRSAGDMIMNIFDTYVYVRPAPGRPRSI